MSEKMFGVAHHVIHTQHAMRWRRQIIGSEVNHKKRKIREALLISRTGQENLMSMDRELELSKLWLDILKK